MISTCEDNQALFYQIIWSLPINDSDEHDFDNMPLANVLDIVNNIVAVACLPISNTEGLVIKMATAAG